MRGGLSFYFHYLILRLPTRVFDSKAQRPSTAVIMYICRRFHPFLNSLYVPRNNQAEFIIKKVYYSYFVVLHRHDGRRLFELQRCNG